jgi:hypothetical protein
MQLSPIISTNVEALRTPIQNIRYPVRETPSNSIKENTALNKNIFDWSMSLLNNKNINRSVPSM